MNIGSSMSFVEDEEDIRLDTLRMHVRFYGPRSGTPVVLLHGGGLMGSTWRRMCQMLPRYRCIAPDMRGHGDSDWTPSEDYVLANFAGDLEQLIAHYGLDRPHVVGMSLGGQTVLHAVTHGLRVRSMALVDVGPTLTARGSKPLNDFMSRPAYPDFEAALDGATRFNPRRDRESLARSLRRSMREAPSGEWIWKWDPARLSLRAERTRAAEALWPLVGDIACPALVVRGEESRVFSAELAEDFVAALPDATLVGISGAGHTVQSDQPEALADALAAFWARVDGAP